MAQGRAYALVGDSHPDGGDHRCAVSDSVVDRVRAVRDPVARECDDAMKLLGALRPQQDSSGCEVVLQPSRQGAVRAEGVVMRNPHRLPPNKRIQLTARS